MTQRTPFGMTTTMRVCPKCSGKGKIITNPCKKCGGNGQVRNTKKLDVTIPAGVDDGQIFTLRGQGDAGANGGPSGDVLVNIYVRPHPLFKREGNHIFCEIPITYAQAVLGDELTVPTIDGKVKYKIPEGTQPSTTFRLKGKGVKNINGSNRGDQYVTVTVEVPRNINKKQKELLKQFDSTLTDSSYEKRNVITVPFATSLPDGKDCPITVLSALSESFAPSMATFSPRSIRVRFAAEAVIPTSSGKITLPARPSPIVSTTVAPVRSTRLLTSGVCAVTVSPSPTKE